MKKPNKTPISGSGSGSAKQSLFAHNANNLASHNDYGEEEAFTSNVRPMKSKRSYEYGAYNDDDDDDADDYEKNYLCCGRICTKSMVIIFNFLLMLCGVFLCLFVAWTITTKQDFIELVDSFLYQVSIYSLMLAGVLLIVAGFIGIISAWVESKKVLIFYVAFLVLIFIVEATSGALAFVFHTTLKNNLRTGLENVIYNEYNQTGFERKSALMDMLQVDFKCCGSKNYLDWNESKYFMSSASSSSSSADQQQAVRRKNLVAESCCKTPSPFCAYRTHPSNINYQGCVKPLEMSIVQNIILLGVVDASVAIFQGIDLVLILLLIRRINQRMHYDHVDMSEN